MGRELGHADKGLGLMRVLYVGLYYAIGTRVESIIGELGGKSGMILYSFDQACKQYCVQRSTLLCLSASMDSSDRFCFSVRRQESRIDGVALPRYVQTLAGEPGNSALKTLTGAKHGLEVGRLG